jgi:hypothetical protein
MTWYRIHAGLAPRPKPWMNAACARQCGEPRKAGSVFCTKHDAESASKIGAALDGYRDVTRADPTVVRTFSKEPE